MKLLRSLLAPLLLLGLAGTAKAQTSITPAELAKVRLTMDDINKAAAAQKNLNAVVRAHPELKKLTTMSNENMNHIAANLASNPLTLKAVRDAGITPIQFQTINGITFIAALALMSTEKEGLDFMKQAGINADNYYFFKKNADAISKINQAANK